MVDDIISRVPKVVKVQVRRPNGWCHLPARFKARQKIWSNKERRAMTGKRSTLRVFVPAFLSGLSCTYLEYLKQ